MKVCILKEIRTDDGVILSNKVRLFDEKDSKDIMNDVKMGYLAEGYQSIAEDENVEFFDDGNGCKIRSELEVKSYDVNTGFEG